MNIDKLPLKTIMKVYDISKTTVYKLIENKVLVPHYFPGPSTKPYFSITQIEATLVP